MIQEFTILWETRSRSSASISMQFLLVVELVVNLLSFNHYAAGAHHVHDSSMHLVLKGRWEMFSLLDEYLVCRGWKDLEPKSHNNWCWICTCWVHGRITICLASLHKFIMFFRSTYASPCFLISFVFGNRRWCLHQSMTLVPCDSKFQFLMGKRSKVCNTDFFLN